MDKKCCVEYVWIDSNNNLRGKTRIFDTSILDFNSDGMKSKLNLEKLPDWNFDGSSTGQASGEDSEVVIKPQAIFNDPFRREHSFLVLCDTYTPKNIPLTTNTRFKATEIFNKKLDEFPWFGLEQEYFIIDIDTNKPLGFPKYCDDGEQGQYYCSIGSKNAFGRIVAEEHLQACISANINISGINAEVAPGQWEFQIGPCEGIQQGDHMMMARYILNRIAEKYNVYIDYEPKPLKGHWNGSGCHTNFSTLNMREGNCEHDGLYYIKLAIEQLSKNHSLHMENYGTGNELRMTGECETASYDKFSSDIANRGCSIRIGNNTYNNKKGYFEDRRPSSNCDPYLVTSIMFQTICL